MSEVRREWADWLETSEGQQEFELALVTANSLVAAGQI